MFHFYNACFTILCDCNTAFSIHFLVCQYNFIGVLLLLMLCTYKECFSFCISLSLDYFIFVYNYMEVLDFWLKVLLIVTAYYLGNIFCAAITYFKWVMTEYFPQLYFLESVSNSSTKILIMFVMTPLLQGRLNQVILHFLCFLLVVFLLLFSLHLVLFLLSLYKSLVL